MNDSILFSTPSEALTQSRSLADSRVRQVLLYLLLVSCFVGFTVLVYVARTTPYLAIDLQITRAVQSFHPIWFDTLMRWTSETGFRPQVYIWIIVLIVGLAAFGSRWEAVAMLFAAGGIGAVGGLVKLYVDRPRPPQELVHVFRVLDGLTDSFPAGHVMGNVAIMGFLVYLALKVFKPMWLRVSILLFLTPQIVLIGLSRIYEGEHWFTDVAGAYLLGVLWLAATIYFYQWGKARFFVLHADACANTPLPKS